MNSRRFIIHLVGGSEQLVRDSEVERLSSREIDDQLVFGRRLHWKVARFLTFEDGQIFYEIFYGCLSAR
jgi:hypothetical protein